MHLQNKFSLISKRFFLLLILLTLSLNAKVFEPIYNINEPQVKYYLENNNYKVLVSSENIIDYQSNDGFKLFLPNFVKEYNLALLRFNSIGEISGHLSKNINFNNNHILYPKQNDLQYLITNYSNKKQRQLQYLLNNKTIKYTNQTDLSFEAYSIPKSVNQKLNKWIYFTFDTYNKKNNKLQYLVYSYYMILDKKEVDKFVTKNYKLKIYHTNHEFNKIHTYMQNLTKSKNKIINYKKKSPKKNTIRKSEPNNKKIKTKKVVRLNLKRFLYMKEFGYIIENTDKNSIDYSKVKELLLPVESNDDLLLEEYSSKLNSIVNKLALYEELFNIQNRKNDEFKEILRIKIQLNDELFNLNKEGFTDSIANIFDDKKYNKLKNILDNFESVINNHTYKNDYMNSSMKRKYKSEIRQLENLASSFEFDTNNLSNKNNHKIIEDELEKIEKKQVSNICNESDKKLNIKCLQNSRYINNFIYKSLKNHNIETLKKVEKYANIQSQNDIAKYYFEMGEDEKALNYLKKAYKKSKGLIKQQIAYNLGVLYATRNGTKDNKESIIYFKESQNKEANFNIAINYYIGLGVKENNALAYKYFSKSAKQGLTRAKENKNLMNKYK